jgi:hypothetical protein
MRILMFACFVYVGIAPIHAQTAACRKAVDAYTIVAGDRHIFLNRITGWMLSCDPGLKDPVGENERLEKALAAAHRKALRACGPQHAPRQMRPSPPEFKQALLSSASICDTEAKKRKP